MTGLIRPVVHTLVDYGEKDPTEYTLREAVEWHKNFHRADIGVPSQQEVAFMNERWAVLCEGMAKREGVPSSMISYMLNQVVVTEINLLLAAKAEAKAAEAYGKSEEG